MKRVTSLLFYLEDEPDSATLQRAVNVADSAGAKLTLVATVEPSGSHRRFATRGLDIDEIERLLVEDRQRQLEEAAELIRTPGVEIMTRVFVGDPVEVVIAAVQDEGFDFVAKPPSPDQGLRQQLFGSIDMHLMRTCPCPVLIGRPKKDGYSGRAVAAVSYDAGDKKHARLNNRILESAAFVADAEFAGINEVHVVHAWQLYGESLLAHGRGKLPSDKFQEALRQEEDEREQWLTNLIDESQTRMPKEAEVRFKPVLSLLHGDPKIVIPRLVKELDADVLSLGTVSRRGVEGLLIGNTAEEILNRVSCSVVTHKLA